MKRVNVYLDEDLWLTFRQRCLTERVSASAMVAKLLAEYLRKPAPERKPRGQSSR